MRSWWVPPTLRGYRASWLGADLLGALTLLAVALPGQMATARLANLPAVAGLYAFVAGSVVYAAFGTNRHLSVGADSTIAPLLATGVASVAAAGTADYVTVMAFTALMVGALLVTVGLCRLGWISEFLSTPVITGLLAGIAVEIVVRQIPVILGAGNGGTSTIGEVRLVTGQLGHINGWSVGIAAGVLVIIAATQRVSRRLPGTLLALVAAIVAVHALGLASHHGVAILGAVHSGLPHARLPSVSWSQLRRMPGLVLTVAFVCIAQTAATVRAPGGGAAAGGGAAGGINRDLICIGAGSVAAGLIGVFPVDASPPNTTIATASGTRSQLANIVAALVVLAVALVATGPLASLPRAMLAAMLVFIASKLFRARELRIILRFDRVEFGLAAATLLVVAVVGIEQGVALAMILSLADRTWRSARPRDAILGRAPGTDHWIPTDIGLPTEPAAGILVYLVYAPLWYGNADYLRSRVRNLVDAAPGPVRAVVLDAAGISDIDYTGLQALRGLTAELAQRGVSIGIARTSHLVHHDLKHGEILKQLGPGHLFASVDEAVSALDTAAKPP
ncbi:MAG: SulP family inorganic anion transporter [Streptosporangiaceae bacterium]|jgi:high affinity sulfate transporter 1